MRSGQLILALLVLAQPATALCGEGGTVTRLSAEEAEAAKEAAARRNLAEAGRALPSGIRNDEAQRQLLGPIHGEVGFGIGTRGFREVFGAASMPIGRDGGFAFAFDSVQLDHRPYRNRR